MPRPLPSIDSTPGASPRGAHSTEGRRPLGAGNRAAYQLTAGVRGTLELEARFARPLCQRDLMRAQQVGQLQDVGRPVLFPLECAEFLGRRADLISDGGRLCLEQLVRSL